MYSSSHKKQPLFPRQDLHAAVIFSLSFLDVEGNAGGDGGAHPVRADADGQGDGRGGGEVARGGGQQVGRGAEGEGGAFRDLVVAVT